MTTEDGPRGPEKSSYGSKITQQALDKSWASGSSASIVVRAWRTATTKQMSPSRLSDDISPQRHKGTVQGVIMSNLV